MKAPENTFQFIWDNMRGELLISELHFYARPHLHLDFLASTWDIAKSTKNRVFRFWSSTDLVVLRWPPWSVRGVYWDHKSPEPPVCLLIRAGNPSGGVKTIIYRSCRTFLQDFILNSKVSPRDPNKETDGRFGYPLDISIPSQTKSSHV